MTLYLNGTTGISGVDGSAGTPAVQGTDTNTGISFPAADTIAFNEGGAEVGRFDSSGRLLIGTSSGRTVGNTAGSIQIEGVTDTALTITDNSNGSAGDSTWLTLARTRGTAVGGTTAVSNGDWLGNLDFAGHNGSSFNVAARISGQVDGAVSGGGVGDMPGRLVFSTTADGASSPTEQMRIKSNGMIGLGCIPDGNPSTTGVQTGGTGEGYLIAARNTGSVLYVHRKNDDGNLVEFWQASTVEGTISVSGTTVSYNGAHLSRWSQIPGIDPHDKDQRPEILRGTVMSNLDEMCDWIDPETDEPQANEQLNKTKISDVEGDKNVAGVFQAWDDDDDTWVNDYYLAMTGDFVIRIAAGVTVERGDLLMSAGDGTAKPQNDDIIRSKTIAKVTSTNVSCTYDDGSYCVPCVLMAC